MEGMISSAVLLGSGRLAGNLGVALKKAGVSIGAVCSRNRTTGLDLSLLLECPFNEGLVYTGKAADIYLLAVSDDIVPDVARDPSLKGRFLVHCSGSVDMSVLADASSDYGVLYPVQRFTGKKILSFGNIPLCIEGSNERSHRKLAELAGKMSTRVVHLGSETRRQLHMAAVFASNFANFMLAASEDILERNRIPSDLLDPLVFETISHHPENGWFSNQTGPAIRGDMRVLDLHRELLKNNPGYLDIYNSITDLIIQHRNLHGKL